ARQFRTLAPMIGAIIDELQHVDLPSRRNRLVGFTATVLKVLSKRVGCQTQQQARAALALNQFASK
ncbi:MAG: hypothetical protein JWM99_3227, partial [Verrucomicrobiales bacterium]|nr:hypothetical protein [Verrucomicrobiales bacterium]